MADCVTMSMYIDRYTLVYIYPLRVIPTFVGDIASRAIQVGANRSRSPEGTVMGRRPWGSAGRGEEEGRKHEEGLTSFEI